MKKDDIQKKYNSIIKDYIDHNKFYFEKNKPKISDAEYDKLKLEIIELEKKYKFLEDKNSPSRNVGYKPSKTTIEHIT